MPTTSFETFERNIRDQLARVLADGGFDPARDIQAIMVNRWPHGYAYEYNPLWDPDWPEGKRPCDIARKRFGRIDLSPTPMLLLQLTPIRRSIGYCAVQEFGPGLISEKRRPEHSSRKSNFFEDRSALSLPAEK